MTAAEQNRLDFPHAAKVIDEFKAAFGNDLVVLHIEEGGKSVGNKAARESGYFLTADQYIALGKVHTKIEKAQNGRK
jgi:ribosomal protein L10